MEEKLSKLVIALRREAKLAKQLRAQAAEAAEHVVTVVLTKEQRWAIKRYYLNGAVAYAKETVARRILARLNVPR